MKIGVAQLNPTIGHFELNVSKILEKIENARSRGVDLVTFPELALTGYPPRDLLDYPHFVESNLKALTQVKKSTKGITIILGFIEKNRAPTGRPFFNSAAVIKNGKIMTTYRKQLLPYYDIFEEERYFEEGQHPCVFSLRGKRLGLTICEDAWNFSNFISRPYPKNPILDLRRKKIDLLINISASPWNLGKSFKRVELIRRISKTVNAGVVFCNQVGANDELVFDGCSLVSNSKGDPVKFGRAFEEDFFVVDSDSVGKEKGEGLSTWPQSQIEWLSHALVMGLRDYCQKSHSEKVIIGLSGGIDSSVTCALAVQALGEKSVVGMSLPSPFSSPESREDARKLSKNLKIEFLEISISEILDLYKKHLLKSMGEISSITLENIQPRIRMTLLMALANERKALLINTSNKSEIATGFSTIYGDTAGAISLLGDLVKKQVYELGEYINQSRTIIPTTVLSRRPSAELKENQFDDNILPPYPILDPMVRDWIERQNIKGGLEKYPAPERERFLSLYSQNEYKRKQFPPVIRVSERSFGMGRRIPVVSKKTFAPLKNLDKSEL